jgi:formylglycine-generating enzyme required for sulfatase activity
MIDFTGQEHENIMKTMNIFMTILLILAAACTVVIPIYMRSVRLAQAADSAQAMVWISGGTFIMGSPSNEASRDSDEIQHSVTISKGFYMGKYEVTQAVYEAVMGSNPSSFKGYNLPVERVSWFDAIDYCNALSRHEDLTPAYTVSGSGDKRTVAWDKSADGYRLPTEAEWEYACRAGTTSPFSTGGDITSGQANYNGHYPYKTTRRRRESRVSRKSTTEIGYFKANRWGLYDMHGNVFEWCWDWYGAYSSDAQTDPTGAASGNYRVYRGGSWYNAAQSLRSAYRSNISPDKQVNYRGFRVVRQTDQPLFPFFP